MSIFYFIDLGTKMVEGCWYIGVYQHGRELGLERIHPHKFRRTMATRAINKGMPIEQVQKILGHS